MAKTAVGGTWDDGGELARRVREMLEPIAEQQRRALEPLLEQVRQANEDATAPVRDAIRKITETQREQMRAAIQPAVNAAAQAAGVNSGVAKIVTPFQESLRGAIPRIEPFLPTIRPDVLRRLSAVDWGRIEDRIESDPESGGLARPSVDWSALGTVDGLFALAGLVLAVRAQVAGWGDQALADDLYDLACLLLAIANALWVARPKGE